MKLSLDQEVRLGHRLQHLDPGTSFQSFLTNHLVTRLADEFGVSIEFLWRWARARTRAATSRLRFVNNRGAL